ncbi:MAG: hypothetical protein AAF567_07720 [Actinomycetota bacterium]
MAIVWLFIASIPIVLSTWALLDAARRPAWAWAFANRSQLGWLAAIGFGVVLLIPGLFIASWYLLRVRPVVARVEAGNLET